MKSRVRYAFLLSCFVTCANAMQDAPGRVTVAWEAADYRSDLWQDIMAQELMTRYDLKHVVTDKSVLDVGCGTGVIALILACYARSVHGIDMSASMIRAAMHHIRANVTFWCCSAQNLERKNAFDYATAFWVLQWMPDTDKEQAVQKIWGALKSGGQFFGTCSVDDNNQELERALPFLQGKMPKLKDIFADREQWNQLLGEYRSTPERLKELFEGVGFENVVIEEITFENNFSEEGLRTIYTPGFRGLPLMDHLDAQERLQLFELYIGLKKMSLPQQEPGVYTNSTRQLIIRATKP